MDIGKTFRTDPELELNGQWVDIGEDCFLLIARAGNPAYKAFFKRISKPWIRQIRAGSISEDKAAALIDETYANTILLGWRNLMVDGVEREHSVSEALDILNDLPDFRALVNELANEAETFRVQQIEEDADNLGNDLDGSLSTGSLSPNPDGEFSSDE